MSDRLRDRTVDGEQIRRLRDAIVAELGDVPGGLSPEQLETVLAWLAQDAVPHPTPAMTERLLDSLRPVLAHGDRPRFRRRLVATGGSGMPGAMGLLAVLRPQVTLLGRSFWLGSAALAATLLLVAAARQSVPFFLWVAPLLAVGGVAVAFRGSGTGLGEAERACPVDPLALALGRFVLVTLYDAILLALATLALHLGGPAAAGGVHIAALLLAWLAPFLFLGTVAFVLSLRWGGVTGPAAAMTLWAAMVWRQLAPPGAGSGLVWALAAPPGTGAWWQGKVLLLAVTAVVWAFLWVRTGARPATTPAPRD
ncbi:MULTISPECIES: hypothetical protein [Thermaerobacter]|uniref:Integral membrane protein n=1 Tax=Thermaerobacter composti TaxID=554949 RepID=A0ABZ0QNS0_9FIRM|nr:MULTISPECIES: hypothetical protein [Thermaerobacter]PZN03095.1 MAG: hypothetical protein DIU76_09775 [Bacillota bacterium]QBS38050.1 hypothetical protein E1B22_10085 [Thermaerobacter sp. FW80]WPD18063.1 hypothetical protein Q5761_06610 [Thermaerobacter composti]